jgi:hypothetical protein
MDLKDFEDKIRRLAGVAAARVVTEGDTITEVHVLAGDGKHPKQLVRDVQSLSLAAFGTPIDRRIVSVVQLTDGDLAAGDRPMIDDIAERIDGTRTSITVTLSWHGSSLVGESSGAAAASTRLRMVAEATLEALRQALRQQASFAVNAVDVPIVGTRAVAIAQIVIVDGTGERMMVGSALAEQDASRAVVRAVLDALNRHIPDLRR